MRTTPIASVTRANVVGLVSLALMVAAAAYLSPVGSVPLPLWVAAYVVLALFAWYIWNTNGWPSSPSVALSVAAGTVLLGGLSLAVDVLVGSAHNLQLGFWGLAQYNFV